MARPGRFIAMCCMVSYSLDWPVTAAFPRVGLGAGRSQPASETGEAFSPRKGIVCAPRSRHKGSVSGGRQSTLLRTDANLSRQVRPSPKGTPPASLVRAVTPTGNMPISIHQRKRPSPRGCFRAPAIERASGFVAPSTFDLASPRRAEETRLTGICRAGQLHQSERLGGAFAVARSSVAANGIASSIPMLIRSSGAPVDRRADNMGARRSPRSVAPWRCNGSRAPTWAERALPRMHAPGSTHCSADDMARAKGDGKWTMNLLRARGACWRHTWRV